MPLRSPVHRFTTCAIAAAIGLAVAPAMAKPGIDGVRFDPPRTVRYQCDDGKQVTARYFNSTDNQIAILRLDGKPLLFVSVLTGSGARYAHGAYLWITKGDEGMLQDLTKGESAPPAYANCHAAK
ncbi:MliC family protein [Cupriavidus basilensis]|uniref:MliC family protein n=1 Tax=Cupriavidus basilensis TaxID=68895 RepID=UPI0020A67187|nr:MliC family protein [Cupriavidus basilensis]MCP3018062.1 MliC family protein [Cupriavidus basilensis]MDR3378867.1 MliC family protein [Cupriavidus basilensis]